MNSEQKNIIMGKNPNSTKKKWLIFCSLFFVLCFLFFLGWAVYLPAQADSEETTSFIIKKGTGAKEASKNLEKQGLVKSALVFRYYVSAAGVEGKLKAGEYALSKSMNIPEIVTKFVAGDIVKRKVAIIEGWNLRDIAQELEKNNLAKKEEFFALINPPLAAGVFSLKDFSEKFEFLKDKPKNVNLEGYFFPDTYEFFPDANLEEVIEKILVNFEKKVVKGLKDEIAEQNKTIFEIITMASLIEKEVRTPEEKEIVSGILWKRTKARIPLQVDATITYLTNKKTTKVSKEETEIDSPYNTYKYLGLPLGPICSPGLESVKAALHPEESDFWYYLSTPAGETIFSRTLEEHNIAKAKYLKNAN